MCPGAWSGDPGQDGTAHAFRHDGLSLSGSEGAQVMNE